MSQVYQKWKKNKECLESLDRRDNNIKEMKDELAWAQVPDCGLAVDSANKEEHAARADKTRKSQQFVGDLKGKLGRAKRDVELFRTGVAKYRLGELRHQERQLTIQRIEEERTALEAQLATTANHVDHLAASLQEKSQAVEQNQRQAQHERQKAAAMRKEVENLNCSNLDKLAAFGACMPQLVAAINRFRRFTKKPIGPIVSYIKIASDVSEAEAGLVEHHLKDFLTAFCVDNNRDQLVLLDLCSSMKIPQPTILVSMFQSEKYDISHTRVRSDQYRTLIDCVEVEEPTVYNHLLDQTKMEQILIIPSSVEAQAMLTNPAAVPKNLLYAIVEGKYQYFPVPYYRSYFMEVNTRGILQTSMKDFIQGRILQAEEQEVLVARLVAGVDAKKREVAELKRDHDVEAKKLNFIWGKIEEKNLDIFNLKIKDQDEQPPVSADM